MLGMLIAVTFLFVVRELRPYRSAVNNYVASSAEVPPSTATHIVSMYDSRLERLRHRGALFLCGQVVLLLILFAALALESDAVNQSEASTEALALIIFVTAVLLAVLVVAGGFYQYRIEQQRARAQVGGS